MQVIESPQELQRHADAERAAGRRIALVPTMGALHAGHLSLFEVARKRADVIVVSIFVNPTQFNQQQDFDGYPRELDRDLACCREFGVDVVYAPKVEQIYPPGAQTWVDVLGLTEPLCGAARPGHFRGVTTIVSKLFLTAKPHVAIFGQKDFQQLAVIRRMVRDMGFDLEIVGAPTLREPDGLALSSRNIRLGPKAREQAVALVRALDAAEASVESGTRSHADVIARVNEELSRASQGRIDYAELCCPETLESAPETLIGPTLLALAVVFSPDPDGRGAEVRLIDNRVLLEEKPNAKLDAKRHAKRNAKPNAGDT